MIEKIDIKINSITYEAWWNEDGEFLHRMCCKDRGKMLNLNPLFSEDQVYYQIMQIEKSIVPQLEGIKNETRNNNPS